MDPALKARASLEATRDEGTDNHEAPLLVTDVEPPPPPAEGEEDPPGAAFHPPMTSPVAAVGLKLRGFPSIFPPAVGGIVLALALASGDAGFDGFDDLYGKIKSSHKFTQEVKQK